MLCQPSLLQAVRSETDACCNVDGSCDKDKLLGQCPTLDAVWNEALRLYNGSTAVRKAVEDCYVGKKIIHKGDQIFGPARNWQLDGQYFGNDPEVFRPQRWLGEKNFSRSKGFTPFGGGHTHCPGRYFAQREAYLYIALLLRRFTVQVTDPRGRSIAEPQVPKEDLNIPSPAALRYVEDMYVTLSRREA